MSDNRQSAEDKARAQEERSQDHNSGEAPEAAGAPGDQDAEVASDAAAEPASEALQEQLADAREAILRTQAEMQNLRRRVERDIENAHKFALERFVGELLPVVDNLERALDAFDAANEEQTSLIEGVELTLKSLVDVLKRFHVEPIDPKGEAFNPELHQAMSMVPNPDVAPNTVVEVFQKGYQLNGRLVRPAMVVVAKAP